MTSRLDFGLSCTKGKHSRVKDQGMKTRDVIRIKVLDWVDFGQS